MPDKEVLERLRRMIRELEAKTAAPSTGHLSGSLPSHPGSHSAFHRASRLVSYPASDSTSHPGSPSLSGGSEPSPAPKSCARASLSPEPPPLWTGTREEIDFTVTTTVYAAGAYPELLKPSPASLPGFRALEPSLKSLDGWVYLDIETTGLAGAATIAFLVGLGRWTEEGFAVDQHLLTSRRGEEYMLDALVKALEGKEALVTFNGKAFDVPVLQARYIMNAMRSPVPLGAHLDFLSATRALGRRPGYGQSLKEAVRRFTGVTRDSDIPGNLIPALYFIYEKEGDRSVLSPVMKHNLLDVVDMACLARVFGDILAAASEAGDAEALSGAGKLHLRRGNLELARRCLESAGSCGPDWRKARGDAEAVRLRLLAKVLRKQEEWQGAIDALETLVSVGPAKDEDYLSLSRCYELGPRDLPKAVHAVSRALDRHEAAGREVPECLLRRKRRLERALARLRSGAGAT